ncbi:MAG: FHA domain-containing protein [Oscillospiraceae bacterium]|nr:FHA domain-containing protein [Oscillospiraceae bacterium]
MTGKEKCETLRKVRREIAEQNSIDLQIEDCLYQGDCLGTCPKCEEELRSLENAIEEREKNGFSAKLAGIAKKQINNGDRWIQERNTSFQGNIELLAGTFPVNMFLVRFKLEYRDSGIWKETHFYITPDKDVVIGRSPECDVIFQYPFLSRKHMLLSIEGDDLFIKDLDSTNGTRINGELLFGVRICHKIN